MFSNTSYSKANTPRITLPWKKKKKEKEEVIKYETAIGIVSSCIYNFSEFVVKQYNPFTARAFLFLHTLNIWGLKIVKKHQTFSEGTDPGESNDGSYN